MFHAHEIKGDFRPLQDFVILRPIAEDRKERFRGGILLPDKVEDYGRCEVMAVGPGRRTDHGVLIPCELKVGQFVFIQKFVEGEMKFKLNGDWVYGIQERHLNLTIDPPQAEAVDKPKKKGRKGS